jgi:hypothetical protein
VTDEELIDGDDEEDDQEGDALAGEEPRVSADERRDYDPEHYLQVLHGSYVSRLRKAFAPEDFDQLFRPDGQLGLFDRPIEDLQPRWIRCRDDDST